MNEPGLLLESRVQESEIDSLGHMNVRFYVTRADAANRLLLDTLGIKALKGQVIRRLDTYSKFQREQFAGAPLQVRGGVIDVEGPLAGTSRDNAVTAFYEIRNPEANAIAATFVITSVLIESETQVLLPSVANVEARKAHRIQVPDYGLPRSLSLAQPAPVSLEELETVVSLEPAMGMMSGIREAEVHADDCDAFGRLDENTDLMFVLHRPGEGEDLKQMGPPLMRDSSGRRYSWAMMETRSVNYVRPLAGETVVSLGADVAYGDKWRQSRRWMFSRDTGSLLGISDTLGLCIDLDARKAIPIPEELIEEIERTYLPQFATQVRG